MKIKLENYGFTMDEEMIKKGRVLSLLILKYQFHFINNANMQLPYILKIIIIF